MADERGPFEVLEIPATGAYGAVVVARYLVGGGRDGGGRVVAVKVLKTDYLNRPRILARSRDEARMLFRLRHPNIVRVDELINVGGRPILVMEWVEGVSVRALLEAMDRLPFGVALEIGRQTALALDAAYNSMSDGRRLRIVHRDIKPSNVLLSLGGEVKVVDFGVARGDFDDREAATASTILGTQGYIAPERLEGVVDTPAVDVYALGVTIAELISGRAMVLPRGSDRHDRAVFRALEAVGELAGEAGPAVVALLERMCLWERQQRPNVSEVQVELSAILSRSARRVDLAGFALQHAVPVYNSRAVVAPQEHPDWSELQFLEEPWVSSERVPREGGDRVPTTNVEADTPADRKLRQFLAQPGWSSKLRELTWLLATNSGWSETPFLEVLASGEGPWWRVWARRPTHDEIVASLQMLRYRRTPRVLARVRPLSEHRDPGVAKAAKALLAE